MVELRKLSEMMLEAWKDRDWDSIRNVLHPDYVYTGPDGQRVAGIEEGLVAGWTSFAESFPDGTYKVNSVYVDGDTVVTEFRFTGTHKGEFAGITPTGNQVEIDFCNLMHLQDGKVVSERDYFDTQGLMAQIGDKG